MEKIIVTALFVLLVMGIGKTYIFGDGDTSLNTNTGNIMTNVTEEVDSMTNLLVE